MGQLEKQAPAGFSAAAVSGISPDELGVLLYERLFTRDVVIDLVGYRRFGHNEQDEAAYTQPLMVEQINAHPSVRELYEEQLIEEGVLTRDEAAAFVSEVESMLRAAHDRLKASFGGETKVELRSVRKLRRLARACISSGSTVWRR